MISSIYAGAGGTLLSHYLSILYAIGGHLKTAHPDPSDQVARETQREPVTMPTFFFRTAELKGAPGLEASRTVSALLHLSIPIVMYNVLYNGLCHDLLSSFASISDLSPQRKQLYMALDIFYSVRWAVGVMVMQGELTLSIGVFVSAKHFFFDECGYIIGSMMINTWGARTGELNIRDYACAGLMILAGILQHGSELQRWLFKRDPRNMGKIHTTGLFRFARGINHTGHILRDFAHVLLVPILFFIMFYPIADYDLSCEIAPATQKHMKKKYGEQWDKYEKQTPWLFIPGIY
uniref:Steroid 5-alpha reductase C-terminal domain-containing protein n=1 Tax=Grammatophora oceanica TaxID=210454 RepID=A0A7S1UN63_9STRA|mmetsp:Transcript_13743/g.20139  ORF Transcript_13743/g.20139 Transcript_13743/m.20139 type:complete len:292 (+) Transcript_13743:17-892(+)